MKSTAAVLLAAVLLCVGCSSQTDGTARSDSDQAVIDAAESGGLSGSADDQIAVGHRICKSIASDGLSVNQSLGVLVGNGMSSQDAATMLTASVREYCPDQLPDVLEELGN
ncbi:hypothetical protein CH249_01750 [Rhodococcus sp. 05-2255-3B1]|nr:hypothetical protein CH250_05615 [Rhodococcus sp. 05-2255-3C]OZE15995.1 hypothetical protein CH249_01750 [Rhodococcus sp. 05-2255-3B1]OZE19035.1 hypothetical protein CH255_13775 [Rhodococcus sp. 05-2255-2A2]